MARWLKRGMDASAIKAADASTARWRAGKPLSPIDGMPVAIIQFVKGKWQTGERVAL